MRGIISQSKLLILFFGAISILISFAVAVVVFVKGEASFVSSCLSKYAMSVHINVSQPDEHLLNSDIIDYINQENDVTMVIVNNISKSIAIYSKDAKKAANLKKSATAYGYYVSGIEDVIDKKASSDFLETILFDAEENTEDNISEFCAYIQTKCPGAIVTKQLIATGNGINDSLHIALLSVVFVLLMGMNLFTVVNNWCQRSKREIFVRKISGASQEQLQSLMLKRISLIVITSVFSGSVFTVAVLYFCSSFITIGLRCIIMLIIVDCIVVLSGIAISYIITSRLINSKLYHLLRD